MPPSIVTNSHGESVEVLNVLSPNSSPFKEHQDFYRHKSQKLEKYEQAPEGKMTIKDEQVYSKALLSTLTPRQE